jgi:hypothetical protein
MNVTGFNISTTAINVSWSLIPEEYRNGIIIGYRVHYHDNMRHSGSITLPVSQRHVTLDALLSYTLYNISVAGLTKIGEGWNRTFTFVRTNPGGKNLQLYFIYHHSSYSVMYVLVSTVFHYRVNFCFRNSANTRTLGIGVFWCVFLYSIIALVSIYSWSNWQYSHWILHIIQSCRASLSRDTQCDLGVVQVQLHCRKFESVYKLFLRVARL